MLKIVGFTVLAISLTALFVYYHYIMYKAIENKSKIALCPLYFRIGLRLLILIIGLDYLWSAKFMDSSTILPLAYIFVSLVISILLLKKIQSSWKETRENNAKS